MTAADPPDLNNVPNVLDYFATQEPEIAQFAQLLLTDGGNVLAAWGPVQMAVWHLDVQRGDWIVRFHSERGFVEWVTVARAASPSPQWDDFRPIGLSIFIWARANGVPFRLDEPDDIDHDLVAHGRDALDWLSEGHDESFEQVYQAWIGYRHARGGRDGDAVRSLQAHVLATMEAAAGDSSD
ncbi:hypothetical protein [Glaciibacter psychrotolerans]|uniref:Uncharacterized protein n=1 Tax=Glaciibacter psychrotolerans TaxID=670054 RepID=A0A7Z0ED65_9MICO|nr:hypothetical protein [Leifsonia psychrotolerans]NYJ19464.1 hypothetical protein [Leifsonia psychrotolerans]